MKKILAVALAALMFIPVLALGEDYAGTIVLGVYEPASGDNGAGGKQETLGVYFANYVAPTVELSDGVYKIDLVEVDNQSSTDKAPTAAQTLVSAGSSIALGSYGSSVSIAAADIFDAAGLVAIGLSCTNPQVTIGNPLYYRICYLDPFQGTVLANFAMEEYKAKNAYTLAQLGNDYDVGLVNYFTEAFKGLGGTVTGETFPEGTSGIKIPILAGDTWDSSVILEAAKGSDLTICVSTFFDEGDTSGAAAAFVSGFKAWLNANPEKLANNGGNDIVAAVSALGYDGYMVALEALKAADSAERDDIAEIMAGVTYSGVTGDIVFGENGDAVRSQAFIKKSDNAGAWTFVKVQGITE